MSGFWNTIQRILGKSDTTRPFQEDEILSLEDPTQIIIALSERIALKIKRVGYENLTETEKYFEGVYELEGEINNGGFDQYFFNSAGDHALKAVKALQEIGAAHTSDLLLRAFTVFPENTPPSGRSERQQQLLHIGEENENFLSELDEDFLSYTDPIGSLLVEYIRKHKDQILPPE